MVVVCKFLCRNVLATCEAHIGKLSFQQLMSDVADICKVDHFSLYFHHSDAQTQVVTSATFDDISTLFRSNNGSETKVFLFDVVPNDVDEEAMLTEENSSSIVPVPMARMKLKIGLGKKGYIYNEVGRNVFKCERGSEWSRDGEVLFLFRIQCYQMIFWVAADAHADSVIVEGTPVKCEYIFRSEENVLTEGFHTWESNFGAHKGFEWWRASGLRCWTRILSH